MSLQIFIADGEKAMRRLRGENVMVLRTDRRALYIYTDSQWINVLVTTAVVFECSPSQLQTQSRLRLTGTSLVLLVFGHKQSVSSQFKWKVDCVLLILTTYSCSLFMLLPVRTERTPDTDPPTPFDTCWRPPVAPLRFNWEASRCECDQITSTDVK